MNTTHKDIIIIGAGFSGIGAACHLSRKNSNKTYAILESRDKLGGIWSLFKYPEIRSDSDMYTFGYSFKIVPFVLLGLWLVIVINCVVGGNFNCN